MPRPGPPDGQNTPEIGPVLGSEGFILDFCPTSNFCNVPIQILSPGRTHSRLVGRAHRSLELISNKSHPVGLRQILELDKARVLRGGVGAVGN
jgi:hypothetical protein